MAVIEIPEYQNEYEAVSHPKTGKKEIRDRIAKLSVALAEKAREKVLSENSANMKLLCVFVLRGGALLIPGFFKYFNDADFCFIAMQRDAFLGEPKVKYITSIQNRAYDAVIFVDCIAGTGKTVDFARDAIPQVQSAKTTVAVIASSETATEHFSQQRWNVIGFSLYETQSEGVLRPDIGALDAGDVFSFV